MNIFHKILHEYWRYSEFRPLQEDIIKSVFSGKDTLGLMPTGGGKSITFQVPALAMDGICLVITPLIALMKDQVDNLKEKGIRALSIYSGMSHNEILITLDNAILGDYKFLYISPERLGTQLFQAKLRSMNVCLLAIDESHCISQWGYDFRPSYMNIADIRKELPNVPVLALTATATLEVTDDIQNILGFKEKNVFRKSFERKNLSYIVRESDNKTESLVRILSKIQGSAIVYVRSRLKTKEIATELIQHGLSADFYHAGLSSDDKTRKQNAWKDNECRIIVSTNAFGMGIDKPDVRVVVHTDLPNSIEEYYQEAGRAGRDEKKAYAVILYSKTDSTKLKKRISDEFPERDFVIAVYESLAYFFQIAEGFGHNSTYDFSLQKFCSTYKYPLIPTHNALKIIELSGYIEYTDDTDNQSRIIFTIYRDELYKYEFTKEYEHLISIVLRLYTGIFADYVTINEATIAFHLQKSRTEVYHMLKILAKKRIIEYIPFKKTPFIIYKQPRISIKYFVIPQSVYEVRRKRFEKRIIAITDYAERNDICRSRMLLTYFGEKKSSDCGHCDVCLAKSDTGISNYKFNDISDKIKKLICEKDYSIDDLTSEISEYKEEDIIHVIRFHLDQESFLIQNDYIKINKKKE
ncbi:ATP-dependent DNA helicase RecQ [Dysgonomonas alginatilytica]|uniref:ATP-dependent DNA helicase RecQ n=1 Tax=Dysgonomonas alginatilytica TaxID=1605892 RepID=A0A2V3PPP4_9BACT|nr:ATP-dependent DNA helicase RecQ [Dysgonomonas alginatilytica]PXV65082.1 ATP-dependent DNA helicase RecQ [Dysgonomonas alginatilytica]